MKHKPLVIVATPNICWLAPDVKYPVSQKEIVEEALKCREAGAAILHTHGVTDSKGSQATFAGLIDELREKSDLIIQSGLSSLPWKERKDLFEKHSDMVSIMSVHHAEAFAQLNNDILHPQVELEEYCEVCRKYKVKPEWEIWHSGSVWALERLIQKGLLDAPYITTFFIGWPGGTWSPPTVEEYLYRKSLMPKDCVITVSIMDERQMDVLVCAVTHGDNVRVGTEDWPYLQNGNVGTAHELVKEIADISRSLGREVATPAQAREFCGI
jgi:3-keto-5-aminohexanoate cleavage enzyme